MSKPLSLISGAFGMAVSDKSILVSYVLSTKLGWEEIGREICPILTVAIFCK